VSRTVRLALAACAVVAALPIASASAVPPPCTLEWEPFLATSGLPVYLEIDRPTGWTC
jgi:hypothetical protein